MFLALSCHVLMAQTPSLSLADSLSHAGRYSQAIKMAQQLAEEAEKAGDTNTCLKAWCILGEAYFASGDEEVARDYLCKCYVRCAEDKEMRAIPDIMLLSASLSSAAKIYKTSGEYEEAVKYLRRSICIDKALNRRGTVAVRYGELTDILIAQGRYEEALAVIDTAKTYTTAKENRINSMQSYNTGLCMEAMGDSIAAEKCFREAEETAYQYTDNMFVSVYLSKLASYAEARGDRDAAAEYYRRIVGYDTSNLIDMSPHYEAYMALARLYEGEDDALSAMYAAKADSLDFHPALKVLAAKLALYNIDFPLKEREQIIRNQRLRFAFLCSLLMILMLVVVFLWANNRNLKKISHMQEEQNESLRKANEQKDQLLEISKAIADEHVRDEVSRIASEIVDVANVKLTKRESEIAALIADGLLNKEIADHLNISVRTVEFHRNAIYRKLGVNNAVELMNYLNAVKNNT